MDALSLLAESTTVCQWFACHVLAFLCGAALGSKISKRGSAAKDGRARRRAGGARSVRILPGSEKRPRD